MWKQSPLTWPNSAQVIQTSSESLTNQIGAKMESAVGRLTNLEGDANYGRHPLSTDAEALLGLRADLELLLTQGTVLSVSPYQFQVGSPFESGHYINPQAAITVLKAKLRDHTDTYRPIGELHCIAVMVTSSQLATFASNLAELVSVFPLPEWCQVARQSKALTTNEIDKFHQPAAVVQPRFKPTASLNVNPLGDYLTLQGAQLATLESLANDKTNVIDKLQTLATKRATKLSDIQNQINALKNLKGSVWSMSVMGNAESIATQLSQAGVPNTHQHTLASLLISDKPLTFFKDLLC